LLSHTFCRKNQKNIREQMSLARAFFDGKTKRNHKRRRFGCARVSCWSSMRACGRVIDFEHVIIYKKKQSSRLKTSARRAATGSFVFFRASSCGAIEFTATVDGTSLSISSVEKLFPLRFGERNWRFDGDVVRF